MGVGRLLAALLPLTYWPHAVTVAVTTTVRPYQALFPLTVVVWLPHLPVSVKKVARRLPRLSQSAKVEVGLLALVTSFVLPPRPPSLGQFEFVPPYPTSERLVTAVCPLVK